MEFSLTTHYSHLSVSIPWVSSTQKSYIVGILHKLTPLFHSFPNCFLRHLETSSKRNPSFSVQVLMSENSLKVILALPFSQED